MKNNGMCEKDNEIREYSIRENIFFATLTAASLEDLMDKLPREEIMAVVIEIAEQFEDEHPGGATQELEAYAVKRLSELMNS